ncbi:hypothetical protein [Bacteroides caecimuris]|uniref:hypothetical protein n=1 Tax=Bacteroides caecimuris TaxID=1796613 RepID=UPI00242F2F7F|nr:hypothetical protein [Bacteroides caecimuris]
MLFAKVTTILERKVLIQDKYYTWKKSPPGHREVAGGEGVSGVAAFAAFPTPAEPSGDNRTANAAEHAQQAVAPEIRVHSAEKICEAQGGKPTRRKVQQSVHALEN